MSGRFIETLFGSEVKAKLVRWLYVDANPQETFTKSELARAAGIPMGSVHSPLNDLVDNELIVRCTTKRGHEYRAPFEDARLKGLFLLLRQESDITDVLKRALKPFKKIEYACIFGSFARGATHRGSDIDVLILEKEAGERFEIMTALGKVSARIGHEVNPEFYAAEEFKRKVDEGDTIALSILGNARIDLKGKIPWLT